MELNTKNEFPLDFNALLPNFIKLKESCLKQQTEMKNLVEENRLVREAERAERKKLIMNRQQIDQQQETMRQLLAVKSENSKMAATVKDLQESLQMQEKKMEIEKENCRQEIEKIKTSHSNEIEAMRVVYEKKVSEEIHAKDSCTARYKMENDELKWKLQEKTNELARTVTMYEDKLKQYENMQKFMEKENHHIRESARRDVMLYKKKVVELEQQYYRILRQCQEPSRLTASIQFPAPVPQQGHRLATARRNSAKNTDIQTVQQECSLDNSVSEQTSSQRIKSILDNFSAKQEARKGLDGLGVTDDEDVSRKELENTEEGKALPSILKKTSAYERKSWISFPGDFVKEICQTETLATVTKEPDASRPASVQAKKARFSITKKRKLFSHSDHELQ